MTKTLRLVFANQSMDLVSLNIPNIREDVTEAEVRALMDTIVQKNVFTSQGGDLVALRAAAFISKETQEIPVI